MQVYGASLDNDEPIIARYGIHSTNADASLDGLMIGDSDIGGSDDGTPKFSSFSAKWEEFPDDSCGIRFVELR